MSCKAASPTKGSREGVMGYDEKEEIEATGEWLLRITKVGFSEELEYVPSQLSRLGVAPKDVVDRLPYLRDETRGSMEEAKSSVMVLEREEEPEPVIEGPPDTLGYDQYGPWEWFGKVEVALEEAIIAVLEPEPALEEFTYLLSLTKGRKRGKLARSRTKGQTVSE